MKQSLSLRFGYALLLMLLTFVQGALAENETKTSPTLSLKYEQSSATVGGSIGKGELTVTDGNKNSIRSRFAYRYSIVTSDGDEVTEHSEVNGKEAIVDPTTGSSVQFRYGVVTIGNKAGNFKIKVTAMPTDEYVNQYNEASTTYDVTVKAADPTISAKMGNKLLVNGSTDTQINLYSFEDWKNIYWHEGGTETKFMPMPVPTVTLSHDLSGETVNDNADYTITYKFADGDKFSTDGKTITAVAGATDGSVGTLTITATPKSADKGTVVDGTKVFTVKVGLKQIADNNKIKTYIRWVGGRELSHYRMTTNLEDGVSMYIRTYKSLVPTIVDEFGNDVTRYFKLEFGSYDNYNNWVAGYGQPMDVLHTYSNDPLDDYSGWSYRQYQNTTKCAIKPYLYAAVDQSAGGIADLNSINITTDESQKSPDDYIITVKAEPSKDTQQNNLDYSKIYLAPEYESAEKEAKKEKTTEVHGMLYGMEKQGSGSNVYELQPNQFVYHNLKRTPSIVFDRNPQAVIATDFELNPGNRFKPKGVMVDNTLDSHPTDSLIYNGNNGFSYYIFVPNELAWTEGETLKKGEVKIEMCKDSYGNITGASNTDSGSEYYYGNDVEQIVYDVDADGNVIMNADGTPKGEIKTGKRYFTKQNWGNDDLKIKFHGTGKFPLTYTIVPWNAQSWDLGTSQTSLLNIDTSEPTHIVISPDTIVTATGEVSAAPNVRVVDDMGNDVTKYFDITATKANDADAYTLGNGTNGYPKFATYPTATSDGFIINVNATLNDAGKQLHYGTPAQNTYVVIVKDPTSGNIAKYEIVYDPDLYNNDKGLNDETTKKSDMGKFHFIQDGDFYPGSIVQGKVPGIDMQIGTATETKNNIVYTVSGKSMLLNNTIVPDGTDLPVTGYIRIFTITNGFLTIDAKFRPGELWILRDIDTNEEQQLSATGSTEENGEKRYGLPLLAGHNYALWSDRMSGYINGLNFDPQFISLKTDHVGWHDATTFQNGYTGTLPKLANRAESTISYYLRDAAQKGGTISNITTSTNGSANGYHAHVNTTTGQVSAFELTADGTMTEANGAEANDRVTIVGKVLGEQKDGHQVERRPHYNLYIGSMPTYIVENGANFDMGNRISTNNIPTRIWMTIGGWEHINDADFPYRKFNKGVELNDGWKTAKMDSVGRDNMTIDNFNYGSFGQENPLDEDIKSWNSFREAKPWNEAAAKAGTIDLDEQRNGFLAPVRGTYLKFEPEESGKLFLYVLQNGMTDISKGDAMKKWDKDDAKYLRRRALYIVDETGNNVDIAAGDDGWSNYDKYLPEGSSASTRFQGYTIPNRNYYCDGILRVGWADGADNSKTGYKDFVIDQTDGKYSWKNNYDHTIDGTLTKKGQGDLTADVKMITEWWKTNANKYEANGARTEAWNHAKLDGPDEVLKLADGGYILPTKGYVRYTFNVKSGKTYYVFMTGSKLGFCGFGFLPAGYTQHATEWINATDNISDAKLPNNNGFKQEVYDKLPTPTEDAVYTAETNMKLMRAGADETPTTTTTLGGSVITLDANAKEGTAYRYDRQQSRIGSDRQFVDVNLKRTFLKRHWAGICLPFSVSETQVKRVFGDHTSLITVDSVRFGTGASSKAYRTLHFTRHVVQNIEAGRPYFIYPDGNCTLSDSIADSNDNEKFVYSDGSNKIDGVQFHGVSFENVQPMDLICYNEDAYNGNKAIFTYKVKGIYDRSRIPFYSYYMRMGTKDKTLNNLVRVVPANENVKNGPFLPGFNTYLLPYSSDVKGNDKLNETTTRAKMASFWITGAEVNGGEVTGIDEVIDHINTDATNFTEGVFTTDGKQVRNTNSLNGLPAGMYIMNGKKYNVK